METTGDASTAVTPEYGEGHTEIRVRPEFRKPDTPMNWFGITAERLPGYFAPKSAAFDLLGRRNPFFRR